MRIIVSICYIFSFYFYNLITVFRYFCDYCQSNNDDKYTLYVSMWITKKKKLVKTRISFSLIKPNSLLGGVVRAQFWMEFYSIIYECRGNNEIFYKFIYEICAKSSIGTQYAAVY